MSKNTHKIDADDQNVFTVLNEQKYTIDYFQREYSWGQEHITQLISDLTSTFLDVYNPSDARTEVEHYNNYYLGPFVVSNKDGVRSIIDGQQRLTSLTLFLIFLHNLQKSLGCQESIVPLIFSVKYGQKSFNIQVEERRKCLEQLFRTGDYNVQPGDDESTLNMADRYTDIAKAFPPEIQRDAFPYFLDWLKYNVILVEITAYSDDSVYAIFEAMNDRGLNLTATQMLKGYILSRFRESKDQEKANLFWKESIEKLHRYSKNEDQKFFQAWLRAQYADTIRQSKAGSSNEDFEKIGTRFHSWVRDNLPKMGLKADSPNEFNSLLHDEMKYYVRAYLDILDAQNEEKPGWEHVFYQSKWGVADSLSFPLMLASLKSTDSVDMTRQKINLVARYLATFTVRRSVNFRNFGASSIRYTMYSLVKELRGKCINDVRVILDDRLVQMPEKWDGFPQFRLHGMNRQFVKYLLSRVTGFLDQKAGASTNFTTYFLSPGSKPFEIEHIWANKFSEHQDEFQQQHEFEAYRNRVGDLLLLPQGTNQSYGDKSYAEKVGHYLKENVLAKSLHQGTYQNNPNFTRMAQALGIKFKAHPQFKKLDIEERQTLLQSICEQIWGDLKQD